MSSRAELVEMVRGMHQSGLSRDKIIEAAVEDNNASAQPLSETNLAAVITEGMSRRRPSRAAVPQSSGNRKAYVMSAASVSVRPVKWLLQDRVPLGSLTLLAGREGIGKSTCAYTFAGAVTRGRMEGEYYGQPKSVIVAATEDSWEHTIVPRLMAADADLTKIYRVDIETSEDVISPLSLPVDIPLLEELTRELDCALILLDPLMSRLDGALDSHKDAEVRQALEPIVKLADDCKAVVLGLIHVNKSGGPDPLTSVMGSRAFTAVARAVLFAMADPDDTGRKLLGQAKNNLGKSDLPTLAYTIESAKVADTPEGPVYTGKLIWQADSDRSIFDALQVSGTRTVTRKDTAKVWLDAYMRQHPEGALASEVIAAAEVEGFTRTTLHNARNELGIQSVRDGFQGAVLWTYPADDGGRIEALIRAYIPS